VGSDKVLEKCFDGPGKFWKSPGISVIKNVGTLKEVSSGT